MKKRIKDAPETIPFDDPRVNYYYEPWARSMTGEGPIVRTEKYNDYLDIWYVRFERLQWFTERGPNNGIAGYQITGKDWTIQEMIDLYSPTKDSKIELVFERDYPEDDYTISFFNIGEKNPDALALWLPHAYFIIS